MITPAGMCKAMLKSMDMVIVDRRGRKLVGPKRPSTEIGMHLEIYSMRPDVNAVVHAHPSIATGFASAGIALNEPVCSEILLTLGEVPLAPYATPGSPELAQSLRPLIEEHEAIMMANHGIVTYADTLLKAYLNMELVEHFARISLVVRLLGQISHLNAENIEVLRSLRGSARTCCSKS